MIIRHYKSKHLADFITTIKGLWFSYFRQGCYLRFTEEAKYSIDNKYQWNKIIGRGGLLYDFKHKKRKSSKMVVWRYNPDINLFQVAEYQNRNYQHSYNIILNLDPNEQGYVPFNFKGIIPLSFYFGGSEKPNKDLYYTIKFTKNEREIDLRTSCRNIAFDGNIKYCY
jgi:hypothetical protein